MIATTQPVIALAWLAASILFILSLRGLSSQQTARQGNVWGVTGMALAVAATLATLLLGRGPAATSGNVLGLLAVVIAIGCGVGAVLASRVAMTAMPELVAVLHSFVGLAAVLVGFANYLAPGTWHEGETIHLLEVWYGVAIGAITFTGSIIAWGKLRGTISGKPLVLPGRH